MHNLGFFRDRDFGPHPHSPPFPDFCPIESYVFTGLLGRTWTHDKYGKVATAHQILAVLVWIMGLLSSPFSTPLDMRKSGILFFASFSRYPHFLTFIQKISRLQIRKCQISKNRLKIQNNRALS